MLNPDGALCVETICFAAETDSYTGADDGEFGWEPKFIFHRFRYIEVRGLKTPLPVEQVTGVVVNNDLGQTDEFSSSHSLVSQFQSNNVRGQRPFVQGVAVQGTEAQAPANPGMGLVWTTPSE